MSHYFDDDEEECMEFDAGNCFPIQDGGFSYRKSFTKLNNKKLSGTVDFRLKTSVTKALLKENKCDERKLQKDIAKLTNNQDKRKLAQLHQQLNFTFHLQRRRENWQREDQFRINRLNFPQLPPNDRKLKSASIHQLYKSPEHVTKREMTVPLLPVMHGETEPKIVEYRNHTYITKQPIVYELNPRQQRRYDRYRGANLLASRSVLDKRFQRLSTALSDAKLTVGTGRMDKSDIHVDSRSRPARHIQFLPTANTPGLYGSGQPTGNYLPRATTTLM